MTLIQPSLEIKHLSQTSRRTYFFFCSSSIIICATKPSVVVSSEQRSSVESTWLWSMRLKRRSEDVFIWRQLWWTISAKLWKRSRCRTRLPLLSCRNWYICLSSASTSNVDTTFSETKNPSEDDSYDHYTTVFQDKDGNHIVTTHIYLWPKMMYGWWGESGKNRSLMELVLMHMLITVRRSQTYFYMYDTNYLYKPCWTYKSLVNNKNSLKLDDFKSRLIIP
jgi:hypothetical protein